MPACEHCGREVIKLMPHPFTNEMVCLKCITRSGFFSRETLQAENIPIIEHRENVRIPVSIIMSFEIFDAEQNAEVSYPAYSVNLTGGGLCFAWEHCKLCKGYEEGTVHEDCLFHPYFMNNEEGKELDLTFNLTTEFVMQLPCYIVYTIQEKEMDIEYVGAQFAKVSPEERRMLELIIVKYGKV